jgi:large subunit ribosomal protein L28
MVSFLSDKLGARVRVRLSANAIRTVEKHGGIDNYLLGSSAETLSPKFKKMKKLLKRGDEASE